MSPYATRLDYDLCYLTIENHEERSPTHDLELVAVVYALTMCWHYLYGEVLEFHTYQPSLNTSLL
jgi:uncharacterized RmlC-like cupin family protein